MKNTDLNITFSKKYNIQNEEYENVKIITFPFSMRTHNCFKKAKILTIAALINFTPLELFKIRGFGKNCLNEVDLFCSKLSKRNNNYNLNKRQTKRATTSFIKKYDQEILRGDFKSIDKSCLNEIEKNYLLELQESYKILGEDLVCECINNPKKISSVINVLSNFKMKISRMNEINEAYKIIPNFRRDNKVISYIKAFTNDNKERRKLRKMCFSENECISSFYGNLILVDFQKDYVLLLSFLNWCSFNLTEEIEKIFEILFSNEKIKYVIQSRARKRTLEYIGEKLGVTRERVRQIEANCINKFTNLDLRINIILKICAEENSEQIVGINNIEKYAGYYATDLIHLLKNSKNSQYTYVGQLNAFIIGDISVFKRFYRCIENLPDFINVCEESMLLYEISNKYTIPYELVNKVFLDIYKKTGSFYHKDRLSMGQVYSHVLKKYYPAGLNVYSDSMLDEFRLKVRNEFGDFELPINNRALTAGITNVCILCGRGVYRFNSHNFISKSLLHAIQKYIEDS
ncbi:MAG: hypothetical protein II332_01465, partial [Kiritimatiellae bacterium]|nr:hypothetical protein [Kiritimatiellia bacterium]